jgi:hypothetical protein
VLSNGFTFRLCNLHNLAFRGLDLAYMPSPPGSANRDRSHARTTRAAFRPPARLLYARAPPSFAVKLCRRGSGRGEVHDGWGPKRRSARTKTGQRRLSEECRDTKARDVRRITGDEKNRAPREKPSGEKMWAQNSLNAKWKCKTVGDYAFLSLPFLFGTLQTPSNIKLKMHNLWTCS